MDKDGKKVTSFAQDFELTCLRVKDSKLYILDQRVLPDSEEWIYSGTPETMYELIKSLAIRGAPAIGVAASLSLALWVETHKINSKEEILKAKEHLVSSRPTAVNLAWALERLIGDSSDLSSTRLCNVALDIMHEDIAMCTAMGELGASLISEGETILTHCNTGGLATAGLGTALSAIITAHKQGKKIQVFVDETRPLLQGGRLTTWELGRHGVPYTLITDSMAASLMKAGLVSRILLGSDRIATNGDFANKIGTYSLAVLAKFHGVPFHNVAPLSTVDFSCPSGNSIEIEMRQPAEVRGFVNKIRWAPKDCDAYNPAFDVTPVSLLTSTVLDTTILTAKDMEDGKLAALDPNKASN